MSRRTDEIMADFTEWSRATGRGSAKTMTAREQFLRSRIAEWGIDGFTKPNVLAFMARRTVHGTEPSDWTKATYHGHLKVFCRWACSVGLIPADPFDPLDTDMKRPRGGGFKPHPLSQHDADRALEAASGNERAWLILAMYAGLRASEIAALRGQDVQEDYIYVQGKGRKVANLPTSEEVWAIARTYPRTGYWFPGRTHAHVSGGTVSSTIGRLFDRLGIDGSIHRARHYYATTLLRQGVHMRTVQTLMRHSSLATTEAYTAVDDDELRAAVKLLPRLSA